MGHTYSNNLLHCVFSTKNRRPAITPEIKSRLEPYLAGIARENGFQLVAVGVVDDHAHLLISLPPSIALAKAVQLLKGGSSKWVHDTFGDAFSWQDGYGAFSIGISALPQTMAYIESQEKHHRRRDFQAEFLAFLAKHRIEYDKDHVFG